ncbi:hypothetical protein PAPHI01_1984 [Pancytospora philotis]|nr:hypothetical protein PAPHI01_1984 [Pancytospora philotis]
MRCASKLTSVAQSFAAFMLREAGLLRKEEYDELVGEDISPSASESREDYMPYCFLRFNHQMRVLAEPIRGDEPLRVVKPNIMTASGYYEEWRKQLFQEYQRVLRKYVEQTYEKNSFEKRDSANVVDPVPLANELVEFVRRALSSSLSSERLRKSFVYISSLIQMADNSYHKFRDIMLRISNKSNMLLDVVKFCRDKKLKDHDADTIKRLDALRMSLDHVDPSGNSRGFPSRRYASVLGMNAASSGISDDFIDSFKDYCKKALQYIHKFPERISRDIIAGTVFNEDKMEEDPLMYQRFLYPEMDYKAWGSFLRAVCNQVYNELKAIQKHIEEVCCAMPDYEKILPRMFADIDFTFEKHSKKSNTRPSDFEPEQTEVVIHKDIEAVTEKMLIQTHGLAFRKTNIDEAALAEVSEDSEE